MSVPLQRRCSVGLRRAASVMALLLVACADEPPPPVAEVAVEPPPQAPVRRVWMRAVGDVTFARNIQRQFRGRQGLAFLFSSVRQELRAPDITFGNLETTIAVSGRTKKPRLAFRAHPNATFALLDAGFDVVSLANNHAEDFGAKALQETVWRLRRDGIEVAGAPTALGARPAPAILTRQGLRTAFLAYNVFLPASLRLTDDPKSLELLGDQVRGAAADSDLVVVSFHWGIEYQREPTDRQRSLGRTAIDAGADLVLGHHPHRLQGVEVYRGKAIAYSLGNFLFDQPWRETRETFIVDWRAWEDGRQTLDLMPVRITRKPYTPRVLRGTDARELLATIEGLLTELGTHVEVAGDVVRVLGVGSGPGSATDDGTHVVAGHPKIAPGEEAAR